MFICFRRIYTSMFFCIGKIDQCFSIGTMLPYQNIPCSNSLTLQQCSLTSSCTLAVSYEDGDILTMLGQDQVCVLHVL